MRVIKPLRVSVLQRVLTMNRGHHLSLGLLVFFPFEAPDQALPEIAMWQKLPKEVGKDAILDEGLPKPRGEVLVFGRAFSPGGKPRPAFAARVQVAAVDKTLYVVGRRRWHLGAPTEPEPITEMPVVWENAFGGPDYPPNPRGMGMSPVPAEEGGAKVHLLPHLEDPRHLMKSPKDRPPPACFGPLDPTLAERIAKMGTYGPKWLETEFPGFARDLDPEYFQVAPEDQRLPGYLEGGEPIVLEGLHPEKQRLETRAPRLRARCFVRQKGAPGGADAGEALREVPTRLETLLLFPNLERGVALFRGVTPVAEDDAADVTVLLLALERPDAPKPLDHYRDVLAQRMDKDKGHLYALRERDLTPEPEPGAPRFADETISDMDELVRREGVLQRRAHARAERELARARMEMRILGLDPDETLPKQVPPPEQAPALDELADFVERAQAQAAELEVEAEAQRKKAEEQARKSCAEHGIDYDAMVEKARREGGGPPTFRADTELARMRELAEAGRKLGAPMEELEAKIDDPAFVAALRKTEESLFFVYRSYAHHFPPAQIPDAEAQARARAEVERAVAAGETFFRRDLTGIDLRGAALANADLREALLEGADLSACDLTGANLAGAVLARAKLGGVRLSGANLSGANLGEADAAETSFEGADLRKAVFFKARLAGARLAGADLRGADFFEASAAGADFGGAAAEEVIFFQVDLTGARFAGAKLQKATFFRCAGAGIDFGGATLEQTGFVEIRAEKASFREARAANLRVVSSSALRGADFTGAELTTANLRGVDLEGATFEGASADGADFSEANLRAARLPGVSAKGARFVRADLTDADLTGANLMDALLQHARLPGARLERTNLFRANLMQAAGDDRTSFAGAHVARVLFTRKDG